jgi:hypothetical protein
VFFCGAGGRSGDAHDLVKQLRPQLVSYFIDAEIKWTADGGYHHGVMPATVARRWRATVHPCRD